MVNGLDEWSHHRSGPIPSPNIYRFPATTQPSWAIRSGCATTTAATRRIQICAEPVLSQERLKSIQATNPAGFGVANHERVNVGEVRGYLTTSYERLWGAASHHSSRADRGA